MERVEAVQCEGFTACLDHDNTAALFRNVLKLKSYTMEAWTLCGPPQKDK